MIKVTHRAFYKDKERVDFGSKRIFNVVKLENIHQINFVKVLYVKIEMMNCGFGIVKLENIKFILNIIL